VSQTPWEDVCRDVLDELGRRLDLDPRYVEALRLLNAVQVSYQPELLRRLQDEALRRAAPHPDSEVTWHIKLVPSLTYIPLPDLPTGDRP